MKLTKLIFLLIIIVSLSACGPDKSRSNMDNMPGIEITQEQISQAKSLKLTNETDIYGTWKVSKIKSISLDDEKESKFRKDVKSDGLVISFFSDGTASYVEGKKYQGAKWNKQESDIVFKKQKEGLLMAKEQLINNLKLYKYGGKNKMTADIQDLGSFEFTQVGTPLSNILEDPLHPANNQWRVVASKSETYKQMRKRLYNHTQHCHYLFKSAIERKSGKVNSKNTASIFRYYDSAISLVDGSKVPSEWIANYYSPDEAMDAWGMAKKYFKRNMLRGKAVPGDNGFVISIEEIFTKLLAKMEEDLGK